MMWMMMIHDCDDCDGHGDVLMTYNAFLKHQVNIFLREYILAWESMTYLVHIHLQQFVLYPPSKLQCYIKS